MNKNLSPAQLLRAIPSEKRSEASRKNGKKGGRPVTKKINFITMLIVRKLSFAPKKECVKGCIMQIGKRVYINHGDETKSVWKKLSDSKTNS